MQFEHPLNGYRQNVTWLSHLAVFLIGPIYCAVKGMWGHFWLYLVLIIPTVGLVWIWYIFFIGNYVKHHYLKDGYKVVTKPAVADAST